MMPKPVWTPAARSFSGGRLAKRVETAPKPGCCTIAFIVTSPVDGSKLLAADADDVRHRIVHTRRRRLVFLDVVSDGGDVRLLVDQIPVALRDDVGPEGSHVRHRGRFLRRAINRAVRRLNAVAVHLVEVLQ